MKRFLLIVAVLVAALFLASCCLMHRGHCGKGAAASCACGKGADCKCVDCKCAGCAAKGASPCAKCPQGAAGAVDQKELMHGPCGAPEGAPAK